MMKKRYLILIILFVCIGGSAFWFLNMLRRGDEGYQQAYDFSTPAGKETLKIIEDVRNTHQSKSAELLNQKKFNEALAEIAQIEDERSRLNYYVFAYSDMGEKEKAQAAMRELISKTNDPAVKAELEKELAAMSSAVTGYAQQTVAMVDDFSKRNEHWLKGVELQEAGKFQEALAEYQQIPHAWLKDEALLDCYVAMRDKTKARDVFEHMKTLTKDEGLLKTVEGKFNEI